MKDRQNVSYTNEGLGRLKIVPDFLPRPEDLLFRNEGVPPARRRRAPGPGGPDSVRRAPDSA